MMLSRYPTSYNKGMLSSFFLSTRINSDRALLGVNPCRVLVRYGRMDQRGGAMFSQDPFYRNQYNNSFHVWIITSE